MSEFPLGYDRLAPATWAYLSSLLMIGLYFKFNRVWSVRNLDLFLLILLAPGLLLISHGSQQKRELRWEIVVAQHEAQDKPDDAEATPLDDAATREPGEQTGNPESSVESSPGEPATTAPATSAKASAPSTAPAQAGGTSDSEPASGEENPFIQQRSRGSRSRGSDAVPTERAAVDAEGQKKTPSASELSGTNEGASNEISTDMLLLDDPAASDQPLTPQEQDWRDRMERCESLMRAGFIFIFAVGLLLLVRMLLDSVMVRRPLLEPNLTPAGLCFIGCSLFAFLIANVITSSTLQEDLLGTQAARQLVQGNADELPLEQYKRQGPGYPLINLLPVIPTAVKDQQDEIDEEALRRADVVIAKTMAVAGQLLIIAGLVLIGARHFNNIAMGFGAATLYLMLPYTAMMTGRVTHVVPAALMVWAVASYRRPLFAGSFIGLAMGLFYYPLFLLPLWISFYWRRGVWRFLVGFFAMVAVLGVVLAVGSSGIGEYFARLAAMFGIWSPQTIGLRGIWALGWDSVYRLPILAGFVALSITFAFWPAQKNFGTLLSCSCALMIAVQFWHGFGGGLYMGWYLPLLLLTIFRPNLEDRVAHAVLSDSWFFSPKRTERRTTRPTSIAA